MVQKKGKWALWILNIFSVIVAVGVVYGFGLGYTLIGIISIVILLLIVFWWLVEGLVKFKTAVFL